MPILHSQYKKHGFTLIELSIVLVIIGLIIGGIVLGQELIYQSQIRKMISDIQRYQTAFNTFKGKYGFYPGDLPNANQWFNTSGWASAYINGGAGGSSADVRGDGLVDYRSESPIAFPQLNLSGLDSAEGAAMITPSAYPTSSYATCGVNMPKGAIGKGCWQIVSSLHDISGSSVYNWLTYGTERTDGSWLYYAENSVLNPMDIYAIDIKIDDGLPGSGRVVSYNSQGSNDISNASTLYSTSVANLCPSSGQQYPIRNTSYPLNAAWKYDILCRLGYRL